MSIHLLKRRLDCCENCIGHVWNDQCGCSENCKPHHVPKLWTCKRCKQARYCSKQCQTAQWKEHKYACEAQTRILEVLSLSTPQVKIIFEAFEKLCKDFRHYLEWPAISALKLHLGKERLNTHAFLVRVRAKVTVLDETRTRSCITFKLVSAECQTMEQMHKLMDWRCGPRPDAPQITEMSLAHRPNLLRIFVLDVSRLLPFQLTGITLPTDPINLAPNWHRHYDPDWLDKLFESIGQRRETEEMVSDEEIAGQYSLEGYLRLVWQAQQNCINDV